MKKFVCSVCGYVHTAEELAADFRCPVCKVPASKFVEQKGEQKLAAVHEYGVYAQTVKNNPDISAEDKKYIFDQLMANFNGECSEVGMYLCSIWLSAPSATVWMPSTTPSMRWLVTRLATASL